MHKFIKNRKSFHLLCLMCTLILPNLDASVSNFTFSVQCDVMPKTTIFLDASNNMSCSLQNPKNETVQINAHLTDENVVSMQKVSFSSNETQQNFSILLMGNLLGASTLKLKLNSKENYVTEIIVIRPARLIDTIFTYSVMVLIILLTFAMCCTIKIESLLDIVCRPLSLIIGIMGQFTLMPALAYGLGKILPLTDYQAFGLFAAGCVPSGGGSNVWTKLFNGNLDLSIAMTCCSVIVSLGLVPAWYAIMGPVLQQGITIPFIKLITSLMTLFIPMCVGLTIRWKFPKAADKICVIIKPLSFIFIIYIIAFGTYTNLFLFDIIANDLIVLLPGILLPLCGFLTGFTLAKITCRPQPDVVTMAIEVSIQNSAIAVVILRTSLEQPMADLSTVIPVLTAFLTPFPLLIIYIFYRIVKCIRRIYNKDYDLSIEDKNDQKNEVELFKTNKAFTYGNKMIENDKHEDEVDSNANTIEKEKY